MLPAPSPEPVLEEVVTVLVVDAPCAHRGLLYLALPLLLLLAAVLAATLHRAPPAEARVVEAKGEP
jgi:hypothetical protein